MTIDDRMETFAGLPVLEFSRVLRDGGAPPDPASVAWRLEVDHYEANAVADEEFVAAFEALLARCGPGGPGALVIGNWGGAFERAFPMEVLTRNAARLAQLRALFIGEMTSANCETSWITLGDITPVLTAFPDLERLWIRGSKGLLLSPVRHAGLRELVLQSAGLPAPVVRAVAASDLPHVTRLELWLGTSERGGGARAEDLAPILRGVALPALTRLGLRNIEDTDWFVKSMATAPVLARLTELDLSLGTLGDEGAQTLLAGQALTHLETLNLSHHFLSPDVARRLVDELPGVAVDVSDRVDRDEDDEEEDWRYVAVGE
ncbi:STM4015 family protein [Actinoplanes sp. NPDC049265]|uniref:STM4015 family protein n=1 Tax=Actinoplanes sp. NPDC049265 TaxID=3363902 RepID=UPI0037179BA7